MTIFSLHEHELKEGVSREQYEKEISIAIKHIQLPGLLNAYHLKGLKGQRHDRYGVLWVFESMQIIQDHFGTLENPKWPKAWIDYENKVLIKFLTCHPDKIHFTDYHVINSF